jgi:ribosomal protein L37AE/L43A
MAYECPNCKDNTLSNRSAEIKVCLKCGKIIDCEDVMNLLEKMSVPKKLIDKVRGAIALKIL